MFSAPKALAGGYGSPEEGCPPGLEVGMAFWRRGCFSWALKDKWDEGARGGGTAHLCTSRCKGPRVHGQRLKGKPLRGQEVSWGSQGAAGSLAKDTYGGI